MRHRRRAVPLAALTLLLALTGCGSGPLGRTTPSATTPSVSPTPTCAHFSPLTGTCADADAPVLIVKIDDVGEARPQFHLNQADLVLVEPVEGGLTRLFAVYNSVLPDTVGPIRSARITDTDLVPAFGRPLFAYSGSQAKLVPYLKAAPMLMVGAPQGGTGYRRLTDRPAPHNYVADVPELLTRVDDVAVARLAATSYWPISEAAGNDGERINKAMVRWPAARKTFIWDAEKEYWAINVYEDKLMTQVDEAGTTERAHATNVVVMQSTLQDSEFGDKFGARTPYPQTVGSGPGLVLVNGHLREATWRRDAVTDLPHWFDATGQEIALRPGNTWWLIVTDLGAVTVKPTLAPSAQPSSTATARS